MVKNLQFQSDQADILGTKPTREMIIFTKFQKDWRKIVDFLLLANFWACLLFFCSPLTRIIYPFSKKSTSFHSSILWVELNDDE